MFNDRFKEKYVHSRIGLRLSVYAVILSLFFASVSLTIFIYFDLKQEQKILIKNTWQSINTIENQLAKDLWDIDIDGVHITLHSLERLPFIKMAIVTDYINQDINVKNFSFPGDIVHPIVLDEEEIGILRVNYNNEQIKKGLYQKYKTTGLVVLVIVGLMGFVFYIIVNQSLIKHITYISNFRKTFLVRDRSKYIPLSLLRKPRNDELSDLVEVLNEGKRTAVELFKAKKEYEEQMEYQANFDLLTGLPNRRHLFSYLNLNINQYQENLGQLVIMFVDLDGFKQVNDSMGHSVGDKVLQECATRLKQIAVELNGYISRLGGDEFIICFYKISDNFENEAKKVIGIFDEKINTSGIHVKLGCSIGITSYPDHYGDDPKQLIRNADSALYKAKDLGRNTFFYFNESTRKELVFEDKIKDKLVSAVDNNELDIYYQPLIDIQNNRIIGFEALLRWHDRELGWISPDTFVAIAEKMGLIFDLDTWVFKNAVKQVKQWRGLFGKPFILSVNFSPTNFYHGNFTNWTETNNVIQESSLDWIELEITERLMLNNDPIVLAGIDQLRSKGIKFSIDDFGIGYSSLGYIKNFNNVLSKIKIDRIFINEILTTDFDIAFIKSIMMLSDSLGLEILAEGVEKKGQVELLKSLGCQYVQGYYYSKAIPPKQVTSFIKNWRFDNT